LSNNKESQERLFLLTPSSYKSVHFSYREFILQTAISCLGCHFFKSDLNGFTPQIMEKACTSFAALMIYSKASGKHLSILSYLCAMACATGFTEK
jgi:hypothetical protein